MKKVSILFFFVTCCIFGFLLSVDSPFNLRLLTKPVNEILIFILSPNPIVYFIWYLIIRYSLCIFVFINLALIQEHFNCKFNIIVS